MSKERVLTEVYPDEIEFIFENRRNKEIKRYEDHRYTMIAVAAGMGAKTKDDKSLYEVLNHHLDEIIEKLNNVEKTDTEPEEKEYTVEHIDKELDKLKGILGAVKQTKKTKRPPEGVK